MLAARDRITAAEDFRRAIRGRRAAGRHLVVHSAPTDDDRPRAGFVVSKAVGVAVTRNLVKRRLRHLMRERLTGLPAGALVVVRALPSAATASHAELAADLDRALGRVLDRSNQASRSGAPG